MKNFNDYKNMPCFNPEKSWEDLRQEKIAILANALHLA